MQPDQARPSSCYLVEASIDSAIKAWGGMKKLLLSAALAGLVAGLVLHYLRVRLGLAPADRTSAAAMVIALVQLLVNAAILAPVAVAIHRMILLDEKTTGIISLRPSYSVAFFLWAAGLGLVQRLLVDAASLAPAKPAAVIVGVIAIGCAAIGVRLATIFPAVAISAPGDGVMERLTAGWRQTAGDFWRLLFAFLLLFFPMLAVFVIVIVPAGLITLLLPVDKATAGQIAGGAVVQPAIVMLIAGVMSWYYAWVRQPPR